MSQPDRDAVIRGLMPALLLGVCACSSTSTTATSQQDAAADIWVVPDGATVDIAGCRVPAAWTGAPDPSGACRSASLAVLSCADPAGEREDCLSNDVSQCPPSMGAMAMFSGPLTCHNLCAASEFGVVCGAIGPGEPQVPDPAGCRAAVISPAGPTLFCCPCGISP
jgi:hypothetical protein